MINRLKDYLASKTNKEFIEEWNKIEEQNKDITSIKAIDLIKTFNLMKTPREILEKYIKNIILSAQEQNNIILAMQEYGKEVQEEQIRICAEKALLKVEDVEGLNDSYRDERFVTDNERVKVDKDSILNCKRVIE